ncbi:MAG: LLM class flavin-dependent oxidoreductase [Actinomycetota bacterium]|nr:LLM class flavin-dependent oxidoreductase [Actinomycetota bacterium]
MRLGAVLSPVAEWDDVVEAGQLADELGFDAIGLWGHYHSARPEWAYISGWSSYGALAAVTTRVRLVPMVLNNLHYQTGLLVKESFLLAIISAGRFELGLGGGDWPESFAAWGERFPDAPERIGRLVGSLQALQQLSIGQEVTMKGQYIELKGACSTPVPPQRPRLVVGVGQSLATARAVLNYADELNLYADASVVAQAQKIVSDSGREIDLSLFLSWEWDKWPANPTAELEAWRARGIGRVFVSLGSRDMPDRLRQLAPLLA